MTINRTTLLGLPLPVTGTESGAWGDVTNNGLSQYIDTSVAGALSITGTVTLANTLGDASATNLGATTAQYRTLIIPASGPSANIVITAPSSNRTYHVINRNATYTVQIRAGANSGVTLAVNQSATVSYDSVAGDYVLVGGDVVGPASATDNAVVRFDGTTGKLVQNSVVTIADSTGDVAGVGALTMGGNLTLSGGTANGVLYLNGSKVATSGSALTFDTARLSFIKASNGRAWSADGDDLFAIENSTSANADFRTSTTGATYLMFSDTDARARGYVAYLHGSDSMPFAVAGSETMRLTSTGLGIGTSSPPTPLYVRKDQAAATYVTVDNVGTVGASTSAGFACAEGGAVQGFFRSLRDGSGQIQLYNAGAYPLVFGTNNTERARITSAGQLLAGRTSGINNGTIEALGTGQQAFVGQVTNNNNSTFQGFNAGGDATFQVTGAGDLQLRRDDSGPSFSLVNANMQSGERVGRIAFVSNGVIAQSSYIDAFGGSSADSTDLRFSTSNGGSVGERARITSGGDFQTSSGNSVMIGGTAARATTAGTNRLDIFDGTAPVGTLANGVSFYSTAGEARVMDAAGNATLLSPHDTKTNEWIFHSKHTPSGKVLRIDVERLLKFVNDHFGLDAVQEFIEP